MPNGGSPTVRRRELGASLRRYRIAAGLTVKEVTERLLLPVGKISRIEGGQRNASFRDIRYMCDLYGITDEAAREHLRDLARASRVPGWWSRYDLEPAFQTFVGLEAEATNISEYQSSTIPGLLQTGEYADAMLRIWRPSHSAGQREQAVTARLERQRVFRGDPPPQFSVVLDEAVLRRAVGGPRVMRRQLKHIAMAYDPPSVQIQVLPFAAGAHRGMDSMFILLDFPNPAIGSVVHVDGLIGQIYIEQPDVVQQYREVFTDLTSMALSPAASVDLIHEIAKET